MSNHILKFKTEKGEWVNIPFALINVYDVYVEYCEEKGITPVSKEVYFETLGNLQTYAERLENSTENINALTEALAGGALPTTRGGTGKTFANETALLDYFARHLGLSEFGTQKQLDEVESRVAVLEDEFLGRHDLNSGTNPPSISTPGLIYFQYQE